MAFVTVTINGYAHTVGCEDGQEAHLMAMAKAVDDRVHSIKALGGQSGEARLLALAALMLADELHDMQRDLYTARSAASRAARASEPRGEPKVNRKLDKLAERAEEIALNLEHPSS
jgi:cell division protein ZapA